jgi:hypothetical protein
MLDVLIKKIEKIYHLQDLSESEEKGKVHKKEKF